jgi:HSP20 family protein
MADRTDRTGPTRPEHQRSLARRGAGSWDTTARDLVLSPLEGMRRLASEMDRMFDTWFPGQRESALRTAGQPDLMPLVSSWPALEVLERDGRLVVRAELPGMSKDDVHVHASGDSLWIEGERRSEREHEEGGVQRSEWNYGRFARRLPLPDGVDPDTIKARFKNGVLEISMPQPARGGREIPVEVEADTPSSEPVGAQRR